MSFKIINIYINESINYIHKIFNLIKFIIYGQKKLKIFWYTELGKKNWGDALNPILIKNMTGKEPILADHIFNCGNEPVYSVIGSILGLYNVKNLIVWGSGFISSSSHFKVKPRKICAVRGPLTRNLIIKQGIYCPEIYGDPALLYPLFYNPYIYKKYELGIIPHFIDQDNPILKMFINNPNVLIISITAEINEVVTNIKMCKRIASSSLHGIIAADAYEIPSVWIEFSKKIQGNRFKFYDSFMSVGRNNEKPLEIIENTTLQDIYDHFHEYQIHIDLIKLIESCPFINNYEKDKMIKSKKRLYDQ